MIELNESKSNINRFTVSLDLIVEEDMDIVTNVIMDPYLI
jgi:hypothetical protein